jgi:hypothetical protein
VRIFVGSIILTYSETILISTFNFSTIIIKSDNVSDANTSTIRLTTPISVTDENSNVVVVVFNAVDFNLMRQSDGIGRFVDNTYLVLEQSFLTDTSRLFNEYQGLDATLENPLRVRNLNIDVTPPFTVAVLLNMTSQEMIMTFSEVVKLSSLLIQELLLQSEEISGLLTESIILSNALVDLQTTENNLSLRWVFSRSLFDQLKESDDLARSIDGSYVAYTKEFITDVSVPANIIVSRPSSFAFKITSFEADYVRPILESWYPDMSNDLLILQLSEPLDDDTIDLTQITISSDNRVTPISTTVTLTDSTVKSRVFGLLTIQLSYTDLKALKSQPPLCSSFRTCFISFGSAFASDVSTTAEDGTVVQNPIVEVVYQQSTDDFIVDATGPELIGFNYDGNLGIMYLSFSEPTVFEDAAGLILYEDEFRLTFYQLSSFSKASGSGTANITVELTRADYIGLKLSFPVATDLATSNLGIESIAAADMSGNRVQSVLIQSVNSDVPITVLAAGTFTADTTLPIVEAFHYNRSVGNVTLFFNDAVVPTTIEKSNVNLVSAGSVRKNLQNANLLTTVGEAYAVAFDASPIRTTLDNFVIGLSQAGTFLFIGTANTVFDFPNLNTNVAKTIADVIRDGNKILQFCLDMTKKVVVFEMVYPIEILSVDPTVFIISDTLGNSVTLKSVSFNQTDDVNFVTFALANSDYVSIQESLYLVNESSVTMTVEATGELDYAHDILNEE